MLGLFLNVGSSASNPNGRGRVRDEGDFDWVPIPEEYPTRRTVKTYKEFGVTGLKYPDLPVHEDPNFTSRTYGHVSRFGETPALQALPKGASLFFMATLENGARQWATFIVGHFEVAEVVNCSALNANDVLALQARLGNNAHFDRIDPEVDLIVKGGAGGLWKRALPLSAAWDRPRDLHSEASARIKTLGGKAITNGTAWYRWTLSTNDAEAIREGAWTM